jgi:hypothetical protein
MPASSRQVKASDPGGVLAEALGRFADVWSDLSASGLNRLGSFDLGLKIADNVIQEAREALDELLTAFQAEAVQRRVQYSLQAKRQKS